jgi:hypothetical protein
MPSNTSKPATQRNKLLGAVGYSRGIGSGMRPIEHLARIAVEAEMVPLPAAAGQEKLKPMIEVQIVASNCAVIHLPLISMSETLDDDATSPERVHSPGNSDELVLVARRVCG